MIWPVRLGCIILAIYMLLRLAREWNERKAWEADFHEEGCPCRHCKRHREHGGI